MSMTPRRPSEVFTVICFEMTWSNERGAGNGGTAPLCHVGRDRPNAWVAPLGERQAREDFASGVETERAMKDASNKRLEPTRFAPPVYSYAIYRAAQAERSAA